MFIIDDENNDNFDDDDYDNGEAVYVYDNSWLGDKIYAAFSPS